MINSKNILLLLFVMIFTIQIWGQENQTHVGMKITVQTAVDQGGGDYLVTALIQDETNVFDGTDVATGQNIWVKSLSLGDDCNKYQITDIACGGCSILVGQVTVLVNDTDSQGSPTVGIGAISDTTFVGWVSGIGNDLNQCLQSFTMDQIQTAIDGAGGGSGEVNTASNLGGDEGLFTTKSGVDLPFKGLTAGSGISLSSDANSVTITATGGGSINTLSNGLTLVGDDGRLGGTLTQNTTIDGAGFSFQMDDLSFFQINDASEDAFLYWDPNFWNFESVQVSGDPTAGGVLGGGGTTTISPYSEIYVKYGPTASWNRRMKVTQDSIGFFYDHSGVVSQLGLYDQRTSIHTDTLEFNGTTLIGFPQEKWLATELPNDDVVIDTDNELEINSTSLNTYIVIDPNDRVEFNLAGDVSGSSGFQMDANTSRFRMYAEAGSSRDHFDMDGERVMFYFNGSDTTSAVGYRLPNTTPSVTATDTMIWFSTKSGDVAGWLNKNSLSGGGSGEVNTASNLGGDEGLFTTKSGVDLPFKGLSAGSGISLSSDANSVTITTPADQTVQQTEVSLAGSLVGTRKELNFIQGSGATLGVVDNAGQNRIDITISATGAGGGETNTASNLGGDEGLFTTKSGVDLPFKGLTAGSGISLSSDANSVTIASDPSAIDHDQLLNFVANEHIDHTSVSITAGLGLSGGGDISATRTLDLDFSELSDITVIPSSFQFVGWDTGGTEEKVTSGDVQEWIMDDLGVSILGGSEIDVTYSDGPGTITIDYSGTRIQTFDFGDGSTDISVGNGDNIAVDGDVAISTAIAGGTVFVSQCFGCNTSEEVSPQGEDIILLQDGSDFQYRYTTVTNLLAGTGETNTASNLGGDEGLFTTKSGVDLPFKGLSAGTGVSLSSDANSVTITTPADQTVQQTEVSLAGSLVGTRKELNFIQGTGATLGVVDNAGQNRVDITISATGAGGGETNTASNVGTAGVGPFNQKTGVDLEFKNINAGSSKITITDDTGNDEIDIDVDESQLTITESQISDLSHFGGSFLNLTDSPSSYSGQGLQAVRVNAGETALEFFTIPAAGETNTASNRGTGLGGIGIFHQKTGVDLEFKSLKAGTGIEINSDNDTITINNTARSINQLGDWRYEASTVMADPGSGRYRLNNANPALATILAINDENNAGENKAVFIQLLDSGDRIYFENRTDPSEYIYAEVDVVTDNGGWMQVSLLSVIEVGGTPATNERYYLSTDSGAGGGGSGEVNTASNLGGDEGLFTTKSGVDLPFKGLTAGSGISLSSDANSVTIASDPSAIDHDQLLNFVANEHIDHASVIITAGLGLSGGGNISATRTLDLDFSELTVVTDLVSSDNIVLWNSGGTEQIITKANFEADLAITESQISDLGHYTSTDFDTDLGTKTTANLTEGANLYYTGERVDDQVSGLIQDGTGLSWTYVDGSNTLTGNVQDNTTNQQVQVGESGTVAGTRPEINFIEGTNITLTVADNAGQDRVDVTISGPAGSGEANTASNTGVGADVFKQKTGVDLEFRSLVSTTYITASQTADEISISLNAHASIHESGGADEIDGDILDIDFNPSVYTPTTSPSEATSVDHLTAHLAGIDDELDAVVNANVGDQSSGTVDLLSKQMYATKIDMTGLSSITMTLNNPINAGVYVFIFTNADDGYTVTWSNVLYEDGTTVGTDILAGGRRMITLIYDGTNYYTYL